MKKISIVIAAISLLTLPASGMSSEELSPYEMDDGGGGGGRIVKDLGFDQPAGILRADSSSAGRNAPQQALSGDIDGNGIADLIVTGPEAGAKRYVAVFFDATLSSIHNRQFASADFKIISPRPFPWSGDIVKKHQMQWLTVADLNGDGYDDMVFSMPLVYLGRDPSGVEYRDDRGQVYVVLGKTRPAPGTVLDLSLQPPDLTLVGQDYGDRAGYALGAGDINGDGRDDLLIGAPTADGPGNGYPDGGEIYGLTNLVFNRRFIVLNESTVSVLLHGETGQQYGYAVAAGNLNGDVVSGTTRPLDDIIAAPFVAPNKPVKMVFGSPTLAGTKRLATGADWTSSYTVVHRAPNLLVGDLNHDRIDDLVTTDAASGVFITYGRTTGPAAQADARIIKTINPGDFFGYANAIADFNGDTFNDLAIVAPGYRGPAGQYVFPAGELHIVWGQPVGWSGTIDLKTESTHFSLYGSDGTGPTGLSSNFQGHWNSTYGYTFGKDLDGDGRAEFFFGGNWFQDTYVYKASQ